MALKRIRKIRGDRIVIEEKNLQDYIDYIHTNNIKKIQINELYYQKDHLDFLEKCPEVEDINISSVSIKDIEGLYHIKSLKKLGIHIPGISMDLTQLPNLIELDLEWNKNVIGLTSCSNLRELILLQYKSKNKNLQEIEELIHLTSLTLTQSNISSFRGYSSLVNLKKLELNYIRNVLDLDELVQHSQRLEEVRIENCKKLINIDSLSKMDNLKEIILGNCGKIPSIQFISVLTNLSSFAFMGTEVEDGDLTPLQKLDYVAFNDKKHYSHSLSDFN